MLVLVLMVALVLVLVLVQELLVVVVAVSHASAGAVLLLLLLVVVAVGVGVAVGVAVAVVVVLVVVVIVVFFVVVVEVSMGAAIAIVVAAHRVAVVVAIAVAALLSGLLCRRVVVVVVALLVREPAAAATAAADALDELAGVLEVGLREGVGHAPIAVAVALAHVPTTTATQQDLQRILALLRGQLVRQDLRHEPMPTRRGVYKTDKQQNKDISEGAQTRTASNKPADVCKSQQKTNLAGVRLSVVGSWHAACDRRLRPFL